MIDKSALRDALVAALEEELALQTRAAHLARDEATNEESRAESKWDTRGQEAAYLAEGQARLAAEIQEAITLWRTLPLPERPAGHPIEVGSVFTVPQKNGTLRGFIGPRSGGTEFTFEGQRYTVVTPMSPLGRAVLGKQPGDEISLMVGRKPRPHTIESTA